MPWNNEFINNKIKNIFLVSAVFGDVHAQDVGDTAMTIVGFCVCSNSNIIVKGSAIFPNRIHEEVITKVFITK